jgi:hypothetical protein
MRDLERGQLYSLAQGRRLVLFQLEILILFCSSVFDRETTFALP